MDEDRLRNERLTRRVVERILSQVVEITASVASHVAAGSLSLPATSYRGAFQDAAAVGLIDPALAASLGAAAGMRDVLVHEYVRTDLALVAAAIPQARADCEAFIREVSRWLARHVVRLTGSRTANTVSPGRRSMLISPSCRSTMRREMSRPRPVPLPTPLVV